MMGKREVAPLRNPERWQAALGAARDGMRREFERKRDAKEREVDFMGMSVVDVAKRLLGKRRV